MFSRTTKTKHSARKFCVFEAAKHPLSLQCFALHGFSSSLVKTQSNCLVSVWKGWVGTSVSPDRAVPVQDSWVYCWGYKSPKLRPCCVFCCENLAIDWMDEKLPSSQSHRKLSVVKRGALVTWINLSKSVWSCSSQLLSCGFSGTSHILENHLGDGEAVNLQSPNWNLSSVFWANPGFSVFECYKLNSWFNPSILSISCSALN